MKPLLVLAVALSGMGLAADARVAECFKVNALLKMDADHYWADWKNSCPFTIDSVYVSVEFAGRGGENVGSGLWSLHLVQPGLARVMRLSSPPTSASFERISVRKISTDLEQALGIPAEPRRVVGDGGERPAFQKASNETPRVKTQALNAYLRSRMR
jgi:hypothetical protein